MLLVTVFKCSREVILRSTCFHSGGASGSERRRTLLRLHDQAGGGARGAAGRQEAAEGPVVPLPPWPQDPVQCRTAIAQLSARLVEALTQSAATRDPIEWKKSAFSKHVVVLVILTWDVRHYWPVTGSNINIGKY